MTKLLGTLLMACAACSIAGCNTIHHTPCAASHFDGGGIEIFVGTHDAPIVYCPTLALSVVAPSRIAMGAVSQVDGHAHGPIDAIISVSWHASAGSFENPKAAQTDYTCTSVGPQTLRFEATDANGCGSAVAAAIECVE